ncbi:MAG TPA: glycoside hydrolase, partial [Vicinamibacteria bacterium]|nr:glycoside hydrolase [Vicinamibacteria bacterium]
AAGPATSDEFEAARLGLQWQWQANPREGWSSLRARPGSLRLFATAVPGPNLWSAPHLLLQKWPALEFTATASLRLEPAAPEEAAGLVVFGHDYAWIGLEQTRRGRRLVLRTCADARNGTPEKEQGGVDVRGGAPVLLRASVSAGGRCRFSYSLDGRTFVPLGGELAAKPGHWVGAKMGLFARAAPGAARAGHADFEWFRVDRLEAREP